MLYSVIGFVHMMHFCPESFCVQQIDSYSERLSFRRHRDDTLRLISNRSFCYLCMDDVLPLSYWWLRVFLATVNTHFQALMHHSECLCVCVGWFIQIFISGTDVFYSLQIFKRIFSAKTVFGAVFSFHRVVQYLCQQAIKQRSNETEKSGSVDVLLWETGNQWRRHHHTEHSAGRWCDGCRSAGCLLSQDVTRNKRNLSLSLFSCGFTLFSVLCPTRFDSMA